MQMLVKSKANSQNVTSKFTKCSKQIHKMFQANVTSNTQSRKQIHHTITQATSPHDHAQANSTPFERLRSSVSCAALQ